MPYCPYSGETCEWCVCIKSDCWLYQINNEKENAKNEDAD